MAHSPQCVQDALDELGIVTADREIAVLIVKKAGLPNGMIPDFPNALTFWFKVEELARNGAVPGGFQSIINQAAELYPHNEVFARCRSGKWPRFRNPTTMGTMFVLMTLAIVAIYGLVLELRTPNARLEKSASKLAVTVEHLPPSCDPDITVQFLGETHPLVANTVRELYWNPGREEEEGTCIILKVTCGGRTKFWTRVEGHDLGTSRETIPVPVYQDLATCTTHDPPCARCRPQPATAAGSSSP